MKTSTAPKSSDGTVSSFPDPSATAVRALGEAASAARALLARFGLALDIVGAGEAIPGTFWGEPEAGLIGAVLYARPDTPLHSVLHEACHYICMDDARRAAAHTNAGGTALEECAVCYLSIILAGELAGYSRARMLVDMDRWGYSFRLGSAAKWFEHDAEDAALWLREHGLLDADNGPRYCVRPTRAVRGSARPA